MMFNSYKNAFCALFLVFTICCGTSIWGGKEQKVCFASKTLDLTEPINQVNILQKEVLTNPLPSQEDLKKLEKLEEIANGGTPALKKPLSPEQVAFLNGLDETIENVQKNKNSPKKELTAPRDCSQTLTTLLYSGLSAMGGFFGGVLHNYFKPNHPALSLVGTVGATLATTNLWSNMMTDTTKSNMANHWYMPKPAKLVVFGAALAGYLVAQKISHAGFKRI